MNVNVKIIPHKKQRYNTIGDWFYDANGNLQIRVSEMSDGRFEQLVEIHERIEVMLCEEAGVTQDMVDDFDIKWEKHRHESEYDEPGDDPRAPYHEQHKTAMAVERMLAEKLGVDWEKYEAEMEELTESY